MSGEYSRIEENENVKNFDRESKVLRLERTEDQIKNGINLFTEGLQQLEKNGLLAIEIVCKSIDTIFTISYEEVELAWTKALDRKAPTVHIGLPYWHQEPLSTYAGWENRFDPTAIEEEEITITTSPGKPLINEEPVNTAIGHSGDGGGEASDVLPPSWAHPDKRYPIDRTPRTAVKPRTEEELHKVLDSLAGGIKILQEKDISGPPVESMRSTFREELLRADPQVLNRILEKFYGIEKWD